MMGSFKALHASYGGVIGGHEARLARKDVVSCSQSRIDWVREGRDVGIINRNGEVWTEISTGDK